MMATEYSELSEAVLATVNGGMFKLVESAAGVPGGGSDGFPEPYGPLGPHGYHFN
jgi:hypothetical protein